MFIANSSRTIIVVDLTGKLYICYCYVDSVEQGCLQDQTQGDSPPCIVARLRGHTRAVLSLDSDPRFQLQQKSLLIYQNHSWILSASADKTVKLWDALQIETGWSFPPSQFSAHLKSSRKEGSRTISTNKLLVPASPSLDTSWRCRNHSSITYFKSSKVPKSFFHYVFQIIKGHLCPTALAFGSLRKLGWMHQSLESHRGNLHKVFFAQGFFASMVFFCIRSVSMSTGSFGVARICWKRKH